MPMLLAPPDDGRPRRTQANVDAVLVLLVKGDLHFPPTGTSPAHVRQGREARIDGRNYRRIANFSVQATTPEFTSLQRARIGL
jgi:hypothetical protein